MVDISDFSLAHTLYIYSLWFDILVVWFLIEDG